MTTTATFERLAPSPEQTVSEFSFTETAWTAARQRRRAEHRAKLAERRKRQEVRDAKSAVRRQWRLAASPGQKLMWANVFRRLVGDAS